ncbi:hypothetical protein RISINGSUN_232 [Erwinia phage vB_EamM_RisingSun]|uniref:Uncharacterized protein n=2 Tax=Risingsunvirus risingsun TaxID=2560435 RepID=A0A223LI99_9CAUD|nr:hypothetical protein FDI45_gp232 [Erwinia phage vB_EamM_RisingSun]ASU03438.1 hypothetical protein RISINGSUN_232 [Erwinia phage vB_EamM_RisingSun]ASU03681.1 hypothetical protein JOAD_234 [Erwinia phage vB_EamM_Joad]
MDNKHETLVSNVLVVANVTEVVKRTVQKVGLDYLPPLDEAIVEEQISKAVVSCVKGAE